MYKLPETLTQDISYFGTLIDEFNAGKIEPVKFKGTRVPMGIYEQRKDGTYMVRVRCTGGYISPEQLKQVALTAASHNSSLLHLTTRQEIQIHHILIDQVKTILPELQKVELSSKGGGGNTVRNILVDINSGISSKEVFDVLPYAVDLTTALIAEADSFTLPRKLKIAFSTSEEINDFAVINDLGFVAKIKDGKRGFKVYLGGSVASNPTLGWEIFDFAPEEELINIAIAAKRFFNNHGNRKNKHKARVRYIFFKEGLEKTKELFFNYYNEIKAKENSVYQVSRLQFEQKEIKIFPIQNKSEEFLLWKKRNVKAQVQDKLFSLIIPFINGNTDSETLIKITDFAAEFGNDVIRFTPRQQIQLRNIPEAYLPNAYQLLQEIGVNTSLASIINNVVSCTGADTCRLGICYSKGASLALRKRLENSELELDKAGALQINISGCPNSCAQQIWSDIGFAGRVGRNERMYAAYNVFAGASKGENPVLGEAIGIISARDLPQFTEEIIADYISKTPFHPNFKSYIDAGGKEYIYQLTEKYKNVPSFDEDKNYYYDWGSEELFSVANKGPAECSAGLFDMIDVDLNIINKSLAKLEEKDSKTNDILYDILFSAARMLLVTKGAEPKTSTETFDFFNDKFINEGLVDTRYQNIVLKGKAGSQQAFETDKNIIIELAKTVIALYEGMDDSLQFKTAAKSFEVKEQQAESTNEQERTEAVRVKDFRGVPCPLNFVKTKIELATLKSGDLLEIWLDDGQPIQNVPGSVRNEGHEVKSVTQEGVYWKVLIKKA